MTFEEAAQQYATLRQQRNSGQMSEGQFRAALAQMTVVDEQGNYWVIDVNTAQWVPYIAPPPPPPVAYVPTPPIPADPTPAQYAPVQYAPPPPAPAAWVPTPPIAAEPMPGPYAPAPFAPVAPMSAAPVPEQKRRGLPQGTWDVISVVGNAVLSAGWFLYSGMAETKPDYLTCGAMLVLPISFVIFRKPLDGVLRSIQPFRSKIPPMVLAGCCVAVPYLISNYLFAFGVRQFPFMFCSYVLSTLASFILMRQPSGGGATSNLPPQAPQQARAI